MITQPRLTIYGDGGSRNNPGEAAYGFVIYQNGEVLYKEGKRIGINTNNVAEYSAIVNALKYVVEQRREVSAVDFLLDSKLAVEQLSGRWKIKSEQLRSLYHTIKTLEMSLKVPVSYNHIAREKNKEADRLVNLALDDLI